MKKKLCRKILEFLLSHNGRELVCRKGLARLEDISIIENLNTTYLTAVKFDTSVSRAAELLMDVHNPFLIYERHEKERKQCRYIITPWDIVMKILRVRGYQKEVTRNKRTIQQGTK